MSKQWNDSRVPKQPLKRTQKENTKDKRKEIKGIRKENAIIKQISNNLLKP